MLPLSSAVLSLLLFTSLAVPRLQERASTSGARTRDVYVSVVDASGAPVEGLTAADFSVREDRVAREVLKAGPATDPLQVALLIDDSQAASSLIQPLREGITGFIENLKGKAEIALITFGERPTTLVEYTTNTAVEERDRTGLRTSGCRPLPAGRDRRRQPRPRETQGRPSGDRSRQHRRDRVQQSALSAGARHYRAQRRDATRSPSALRPVRSPTRCETGT